MTGAQLAEKVRNPNVGAILREEPGRVSAELVLRLCERARIAMRSDISAAASLAEAACSAARFARDKAATAEALRMRGHVRHLGGDNRGAVAAYKRAVQILERLGRLVDAGRTRSSALQSLIYLGQYEQAQQWASAARRVFEQDGDSLRLARLDSNEANILHRQDRYVEALALYSRALTALRGLGDLHSTAIALRNSAVCHTALYDFTSALNCYREAAALYRQEGLPLLAAEIGDNIAQMHHMQGQYIEALENYRAANAAPRANSYHLAVARLDQSDLLLELNLFTEAAELASNAAERLAQLGVRYERAKAILNRAIAVFRLGYAAQALRLLRQSKVLFQREGNPVWEATVDFYRAAFLLDQGKLDAARASANLAMDRLNSGPLASKSISSLLLLVKVEIQAGRWAEAWRFFERAQSKGREADTLPLRFQLAMQEATLRQAQGDYGGAWTSYEHAASILETLRGQFGSDGLRLSFLSDKAGCYERLSELALRGWVARPLEDILELVEQVKSRSLADAMVQQDEETEEEGVDVRTLREQLSWCYRQLDRAESATANADVDVDLRTRIQGIERQLRSEWSARSAKRLDAPGGFSGDAVRRILAPNESLIEYFATGGDLFAFVMTSAGLYSRHLGSVAELESVCRLFRFQMSRGLGTAVRDRGSQAWLDATLGHLRRLYRFLVYPLERWLSAGHWVVIPHGVLHRLPFHALYDGDRYLADYRTVSSAPAAKVHLLCHSRPPSKTRSAVIFGVPDSNAPQILDEVTRLGARIAGARLFVGEQATLGRWREEAPNSRLIHLATHGVFRQDNPLFSSVRLGDNRLALYDLYNIRLHADLVTMSGCATGVQEPGGGDEHVGLARGLLVAGARAAQVSLWEVSDASTSSYMSTFYTHLGEGRTIAEAARQAMLAVRNDYPHPFHWAPFSLTGNVNTSIPGIFFLADSHPIEKELA